MTFTIHPVARLFPSMDEDQFAELVKDIEAHGQREPITVYQGAVIDGVHRLRACEQLKREPAIKEWDGVGTLVEYVVSMNLKRRHLTVGQRAMIAERLVATRQGDRTDIVPDGTRLSPEGAARLLNVGTGSIDRARVVRQRGTPQLIDAVERGEIPVNKAARAAAFAPDQQMPIARAPRKPVRRDPTKPRRDGNKITVLDRVDRAIETMETMSEIVEAAMENLNSDKRQTMWAKRLREIREVLSRFIRRCEAR